MHLNLTSASIEQPSPADYKEIVEVWEASVRATHHFLTEADIQFFKPLILNEFLKMVELYCLRDRDSKLAGFLGVAEGKIEMLFIRPEVRGQGIGKKLLLYAISELGTTKVDVNEQNVLTTEFYQRFGFNVIDRSAVDGMGKPYPLLHLELGQKNSN